MPHMTDRNVCFSHQIPYAETWRAVCFLPKILRKERIMKKLLALAILVAATPNVAGAAKFEAAKNGHEVIAHTSRAPVVVHKIFPPYGLHRHVYAGSIKN
jgi:hypothetical protein